MLKTDIDIQYAASSESYNDVASSREEYTHASTFKVMANFKAKKQSAATENTRG